MSGFVGVVVDPSLQSHFSQVELRNLKSKYLAVKKENGKVTYADLPPIFANIKSFSRFKEEEIKKTLSETSPDLDQEVDFEGFLKAHLSFQTKAISQIVSAKNAAAFLKASTTTLLHTVNQSEKGCYVHHINAYLGDDPFLKQLLPLDPESDDLFRIAKDGVLLCKLINIAVPGTIDERAINTKKILNLWERNENHTLCLNSAKAIGCTVVNIGANDLVEGRTHLVLGLISQIIKIQLLADLNLRRTPQLIELVDDSNDLEELMNLSPEKVLLKWMNYHLARAGYEKTVSNFSSDLKDGEAYTYLLNTLAPEHCDPDTLDETDPVEKAKLALDHAERMGCKRYLDSKDVVQGSSNLNLAFIAQIFKIRNGLSVDGRKVAYAEMMTDDVQTSREERCFRFWMNSLGSVTFVNNLFEDLRTGWPLLEALDKIFPGSVQWKLATKPPIKMPFRKVENCNQVIDIGKQLNFSLVNVAGNDIVQGNKKLILAFLWQLMRCNMLQLLKNLRSFSHGKEISDADILNWANGKVRKSCRRSRIESFKDNSLSTGIFFLELLGAVAPRVVNWNLVTKGIKEEEKRLNATYVISVARKIGCCVFLLPEDIMEVNQKMILTLTASIMYWWCLQQEDTTESSPRHSDQAATITDISSNATPESSPRHSDQAATITDISSNASPESSPRHSDQAATITDISSIATPESSPRHSDQAATIIDISSNATSVFSEDESSISGEISSLTIDDTASSDTTVENVEYD